ncbi:carbohydrate kinase family protein [Antrihabitans cavernicola]|uniref:Carbohydrate kinase n=1 Tax=Antrihabitans cavernicola TaxID=2495913 RepID=A0A5A7S7M6_9NOCA|nr:carbohydrate kinase [Spelaeibacter cavernicola]KAA0021199.1 carbohydrate kinase [Spelaeibacter cavernicola]
MNLLVCGEALVDLVPTDDGLLAPKLGGGPFNVGVTLGRLGSAVGFLSRLSTDPLGERLLRRLSDSGVDTSLVQRGPEPTTLALTSIDDDGGAQYTFYAEGTADRLVADPGQLPDTVTALSFGTLSLLYEPGATVYENLMIRSRAAGKAVMLDPNVRPAAISDPAAYRARFDSWLPHVDILKVSVDDADWLAADNGSTESDWLRQGVGAVLTTRGADGLSVRTPDVDVTVPVAGSDVVDTIGAGDTVHGALLHWLDKADLLHPDEIRICSAQHWEQALRFAARAAAVTVSRAGADPPWAKELAGD